MARGSRMIGFRTVSLHMYNFKGVLTTVQRARACGKFAVNELRDTLAQPYAALLEKALAIGMSVGLTSPLSFQAQSSLEK